MAKSKNPNPSEEPTPTPDNNEEELNIDGPDMAPPPEPKEGESGEQTDVNLINPQTPDLSDIIKPGSTNEEFIDQLLQVDPSTLIRWEECHLPSKGLYYDGWPDGMIQVKPMGQVAEKILATQRLAQSGQSLDMLFQECCRFPMDFDSGQLLLGDRVFLLYYLRGITHGNMYEFAITCPNPNCETTNTHNYDLNELSQTIVWANSSLGAEPFKVELPYISEATQRDVWVGIRFLRGFDGNDMLARRRARKKITGARPGGVRTNSRHGQGRIPRQQQNQNQALDNTISENMEKIIVSICGVTDPFKVRQFISQMHAQDTATVREWLRMNTPGIDNTVTVQCPDCVQEFTVELPITESFFRPTRNAGV